MEDKDCGQGLGGSDEIGEGRGIAEIGLDGGCGIGVGGIGRDCWGDNVAEDEAIFLVLGEKRCGEALADEACSAGDEDGFLWRFHDE